MPQAIRLLVPGRGAALIALGLVLLTRAGHAQEAQMVPVTVDGERVRLEMRIYTPAGAGPSPTLVFNHGSTGLGTNPESFTRSIDFPEVARFLVARGWAVVIPARRGRGGSEGLYDVILAMPFVDRTRVIIGGQSRGGSMGSTRRGLPEATWRQPMTRPPITRIESPVT